MTSARQDLLECAPKFGVGVEIKRWRGRVIGVVLTAPEDKCFTPEVSWGMGRLSPDRSTVYFPREPLVYSTDLYREANYQLRRNVMLFVTLVPKRELDHEAVAEGPGEDGLMRGSDREATDL